MSYWILQCNPRKYKIFVYWEKYANLLDSWGVSLFKDKIKPGDHTFIWLSNQAGKRNRGIYAKAEVVTPPDQSRPPFMTGEDYWIDETEKGRLEQLPRLELRYLKIFPEKPLLADKLKTTLGLENLTILKVGRKGIYKLSENEGRIIESLID